MNTLLSKISSLLLIISLTFIGLAPVGETLALFQDTETSLNNTLASKSLDFFLLPTPWSPEISMSLFPGDTVSKDILIENEGSLGFDYTARAQKNSGDDGFCETLELKAALEGIPQYSGKLFDFISPSLTYATSTDEWSFEVRFPDDAEDNLEEKLCGFAFVFEGSQEGWSFGEGFFDSESDENTLASGTWGIVLNEFLPNPDPDGFEFGFDFGQDNDNMPQGEWVEIYNLHNHTHDLSNWYTRDSSASDVNKILITPLNTNLATTVIPANGWLVVYMNKAILNNTQDTVRLFDENDRLIDSHVYDGNEFCDLEPTPGDENADNPSGECAGVPKNKSYARIPDGTGGWVDPIPTPGAINKLEPSLREEPSFSLYSKLENEITNSGQSLETQLPEVQNEVPINSEGPFDEPLDEQTLEGFLPAAVATSTTPLQEETRQEELPNPPLPDTSENPVIIEKSQEQYSAKSTPPDEIETLPEELPQTVSILPNDNEYEVQPES